MESESKLNSMEIFFEYRALKTVDLYLNPVKDFDFKREKLKILISRERGFKLLRPANFVKHVP